MNNKAKSFRSRKVDAKRPLPVYRASEIPDLDENLSAQRSVPLIDTGVEKEEETEHHLQAAISAANAHSEAAKPIYIPTPDASRLVADYDGIARALFHRPHTYIRFSSTVEECGAQATTATATATNDSAAIAASTGKPIVDDDLFEDIMDTLEDLADRQPNVIDKEYAEVESAIKETAMRQNIQHVIRRAHNGLSIMPQLKTDEQSQKESDPYLCFRRREVKPMRKTRRSDAQSLDKLRQLRSELHQACHLLEMVDRREKMRQESLALEQLCFDQKMIMRELRQKYNFKDESDGLYHVKKKLKKVETRHLLSGLSKQQRSAHGHANNNGLSILPNEGEDGYGRGTTTASAHDELFAKRIEEELQQRRLRDVGWYDITEDPYQPFPIPVAEQRFKTINQHSGIQYRRRTGPPMPLYRDTSELPLSRSSPFNKRTRFDNDNEYDDTDWLDNTAKIALNEWNTSLLNYRAGLLTESDLQQAKTKPWLMTQSHYAHLSASSTTSSPGSSFLSTPLHRKMADLSGTMTDDTKSPLKSSIHRYDDELASPSPIHHRATPSDHDIRILTTHGTTKHKHTVSGPPLSPSSPLSESSPPSSLHSFSSANLNSVTAIALSKPPPTASLPSPSAVVNANRSMGALMLTTGDALARSIPNVHSNPGTPQLTTRQDTVSPINSPHVSANKSATSPLIQRLPVPPH
ncbi:enhancer of polycomb-like-domain-containing protein [Syncephalis fuscata]|nr:enhancer of polycomb-like-domain-containing protein [Syncephalis fuscata]